MDDGIFIDDIYIMSLGATGFSTRPLIGLHDKIFDENTLKYNPCLDYCTLVETTESGL